MNHKRLSARGALAPLFTSLFAALVLAGCSTTPTFEPVAPPAAPLAFKELDGLWAALRPAEAQARGQWWKSFADPLLDDLVARADRNNTSIQLASARLAQARALLRSIDADRLPQLGLNGGANRQSASPALGTTAAGNVFNAGLGASYEPDLFSRLAGASNAAAREALVQSTPLLVQSDVAQTYFGLRALDAERALVRQTVVAYRDTLHLTERRHAAGDVAKLDLARVRTEVASTESQALALDRRRAELEHALAVLLGELPSALTLTERLADKAGRTGGNDGTEGNDRSGALPQVPPGVPSTVLARRPDVAAAQRTTQAAQAAQARVGIAQAAWFPDVSLTASGGFASADLGDLFKWSARRLGRRRVAVDSDLRRRSPRSRRAKRECAMGHRRRGLPRAGARGVPRCRGPVVVVAPARRSGDRPSASRRFGQPRHRVLDFALPQRLRQPARAAGCAPQRAREPQASASSALGAVPVDDRVDQGVGRRLGHDAGLIDLKLSAAPRPPTPPTHRPRARGPAAARRPGRAPRCGTGGCRSARRVFASRGRAAR